MIICTIPKIVEECDRWGRPLKQFSVNYIKGEIPNSLWEMIKLYQNGVNHELTEREIFEINIKNPHNDEYFRTFICFGQKILYEWSTDYDLQFKKLLDQLKVI